MSSVVENLWKHPLGFMYVFSVLLPVIVSCIQCLCKVCAIRCAINCFHSESYGHALHTLGGYVGIHLGLL